MSSGKFNLVEQMEAKALAERAGLELVRSIGRDGGAVYLLRDESGRIQFKRTQVPDLMELLRSLVLPPQRAVDDLTMRARSVGLNLVYDPQHGQYLLIPITGSVAHFAHCDSLREVKGAIAQHESAKAGGA